MIRSYNDKDADLLVPLWLRCSLEAHDFISEKYWKKQSPRIKNEYLPNSETFVEEENGKIRGFVSLVDGKYIGGLFVDTDCQGQGVGTRLIRMLQQKCRHLELKVYEKNPHAAGFYARRGFIVRSTGVDAETGENEILMQWRAKD